VSKTSYKAKYIRLRGRIEGMSVAHDSSTSEILDRLGHKGRFLAHMEKEYERANALLPKSKQKSLLRVCAEYAQSTK
jgi:hypothetical protein